jgi:hypothetical protein
VVPHEFDAGVFAQQVNTTNPVAHSVLRIDTIEYRSRNIRMARFRCPFATMPPVPP